MNEKKNIYFSSSQITILIISALIGVGFTYLPNSTIEDAKQDGWMACIFGGIYPLYLIIMASYFSKVQPKENILELSKDCFGNIIGSILNAIFLTFFLFVLTAEISGFSNVFVVYATSFLNHYVVNAIAALIAAYVAFKGLKPLARLCEVIFYLTIILLILPLGALKEGSILNIMPVGSSGIMNIIKASKETSFFYTGAEVALLVYPFSNGSKKLLKYGVIGIAIVIIIYTWISFLTIYYFGIDISPKLLWPTIGLSDSIHIPIINSFRYIFISLWSLVILRCISVYYSALAFGVSRMLKKSSIEVVTIFLYPAVYGISMLYGNTTTRRYYSNIITPYLILYVLSYVSLIGIIIRIKRGRIYENK